MESFDSEGAGSKRFGACSPTAGGGGKVEFDGIGPAKVGAGIMAIGGGAPGTPSFQVIVEVPRPTSQ